MMQTTNNFAIAAIFAVAIFANPDAIVPEQEDSANPQVGTTDWTTEAFPEDESNQQLTGPDEWSRMNLDDAPEKMPCDRLSVLDKELLPFLRTKFGAKWECRQLTVQTTEELLFRIQGNDGKQIKVSRYPKTISELGLSKEYAEGGRGTIDLPGDVVTPITGKVEVAAPTFKIWEAEAPSPPTSFTLVQSETQYAMGWIPPTKEQLDSIRKWIPEPEMLQTLPQEYSFPSNYPGASANEIVHQGGCGACWAFSVTKAMSMNLYHKTKGRWNVQLSEQNAVSCAAGGPMSGVLGSKTYTYKPGGTWKHYPGCLGGQAAWLGLISGASAALRSSKLGLKLTERRCDTYTAKDYRLDKCGSYTANDCNKFQVEKGKFYLIAALLKTLPQPCGKVKFLCSNAVVYSISKVKAALIQFGALSVAHPVSKGYQMYKGGIYAGEKMRQTNPELWDPLKNPMVGQHAVTLVGWGVENGEEYWVIQNSWGPAWGEKGTMRMTTAWSEVPELKFGTSIVKFAIYALSMEVPDICSKALSCKNGGTWTSTCACSCKNGFSGNVCSTCALKCPKGVRLDESTCKCKCPADSWGSRCQYYLRFSLLPLHEKWPMQSGTKLKVEWNLEKFFPASNKETNAIHLTIRHAFKIKGPPIINYITSKTGSYEGGFAAFKGWGSNVGNFLAMREVFGKGSPSGELCPTAHLSLGKNEFKHDMGVVTRKIPCIKVPLQKKTVAVTGEDGNCLCGGSQPAVGSLQDKLQCPEDVYKKNCCPSVKVGCKKYMCVPLDCGGRTGRKKVLNANQKAEEAKKAAKKKADVAVAAKKKTAKEAADAKKKADAADAVAAAKKKADAAKKKAAKEAAAAKKMADDAKKKAAKEAAAAKKKAEATGAAKKKALKEAAAAKKKGGCR